MREVDPITSVEDSVREILDYIERTKSVNENGISPYFLINRYRGHYMNTYKTPPNILELAFKYLGLPITYLGPSDDKVERWKIDGVGICHIKYKHH